jgi:lipopolysaccharide transport system ATP-binding protein
MSDIAIRVENLSKQYRIGQREAAYKTLRESVMNLFSRRDRNPETIWALKDVSFEVERGEVIGIIGRNGSGKSTLLKILSRVTEPTKGHAYINGRVGSLLEVGTGFHPELTGRENVFLNGAILGMTKTEVKRKLDEIVAFAEIGKFINTPVKRYSSGMYVRLAFAVAAHLEPEILLVDEVLAVGDVAFQKKCLDKMGDISKEGRTVLFVSHNMSSIVNLCSSVVWLDNGQVRALAEAQRAVQSYLIPDLSASSGTVVFDEPESTKEAFIYSVELKNEYNEISSQFDIFSPIKINTTFCCRRRFESWRVFAAVTRCDGIVVFSTTTWDYNKDRHPISTGFYCASLLIPGRLLAAGSYLLTLAFGEPPIKRHDVRENVLRFEVLGKPFEYDRSIGILAYPFEWHVDDLQTSKGW